ncbi:hypothetical protein [Janthinobacterium sp. HLX7-2]|uniref:hypothetical protein n=1 Tax=Janthinobacterium sp. HLX7-2 TaxID=1259331 RepID=UPI003F523A0D
MFFVLGFVVVIGGFCTMSKPFRLLFLTVFCLSLIYGYSVSYHVNGSGPDGNELKMLLNLYSLNIGLFVLACYLGYRLNSSKSVEMYQLHRLATFKFLIKWGAIYFIYSFIVKMIINKVMGDDDAGFFVMKAFGLYFFGLFLILLFAIPWVFRRLTQRR